MRILLLANPISGRGKGERLLRAFSASLQSADHETIVFTIGPGFSPAKVREAMPTADLMVIIGGDGTVHHSIRDLAASGVPFYHVPTGNENLIAREFQMDASPETLRRAIERWRLLNLDAGTCNETPFLIMCSVGFDANVVTRLDETRSGTVTHLSYARPIIREAVRPAHTPLVVEADGQRIVEGRSGLLVVANSRQYAVRLDPALNASMTDGKLDAVFMPSRSRIGLIAWAVRCRTRLHVKHRDLVYRQAGAIRIHAEIPDLRFQLDGEAGKRTAEPERQNGHVGSVLEIGVLPGAVRVLLPTGAPQGAEP